MRDEIQCFCCNARLEVEIGDTDPLDMAPVYDGLIFRSAGNFGSTVFDPMPIGVEEYLQVIICDDCIKTKIKRVTRIHNIDRSVTSSIEGFRRD